MSALDPIGDDEWLVLAPEAQSQNDRMCLNFWRLIADERADCGQALQAHHHGGPPTNRQAQPGRQQPCLRSALT